MSEVDVSAAIGDMPEVAPAVEEAASASEEVSVPAPEADADAPAAADADATVPEEKPSSNGGIDQSVPAVEPAPIVRYDPSMPADEMLTGGGYDPSVPADEMQSAGRYDPSMPADEMERAPSGGGYDPSVPQDQEGEDVGTEAAPTYEDIAYDNPPDTGSALGLAPPMETQPTDASQFPEAEPKVGIPEGLSEGSASVVANPQLVRQYRQHPSESSYILALFNWSIQKTEVVDARVWYEILAVENPTASQPMLALINLELALNNFGQVEDLFARALRSSTTIMAAADVNLWKAYLHYIRRQNPAEGPDAEKARATVTQAYEYALKECGIDRESGDLWQEYIQYIAEPRSKNPWEVQQQNDTLRKLYQRAVAIPLNNVEALWKAYDAFESAQNKLTAKKFLADRSPAYMTARTALREMRGLTDVLPHPVIPPAPDFSENDRRIVAGWRAYVKWEESNPLATEDQSLVVQRVSYALKKCMAQMRHFPELWYYAASYHTIGGRADEGLAFLKAGVAACPKSFLLTFALAELEEERENFTDCHNIFQALIKHLDDEIEDLTKSVVAEVEAARGPEIPPAASSEMESDESDFARLVREREERGKIVQERRGKDIQGVKTAAGIVWVMYMRFARRAEGLKAARIVFGKARKSPNVTWHMFEASALMEYHSNKEQTVAVRIFEFGLKLFSEDVDFVMSYLQFLLSINDETNARALFERSALKIPAEHARPLWDMWARFEYMYGDLPAVRKLEARFTEAFPKDMPLKRFASRYIFDGIDEIAIRDLGFGRGRTAHLAAPATGATVLPPFPPTGAPRVSTPMRSSPQKRALSPPRSPGRVDTFKRPRGVSPAPRFQPPVNRFAPTPPAGRQSPNPMVRPPVPVARAAPVAPPVQSSYTPPAPGGIPQALSWFIGRLPPSHSFDGPIFRADDIMGLIGGIASNGAATPPHNPHAPARPPMAGRPGGFRGLGRRY